MTTKTIRACNLTTRHQIVTAPGELSRARQQLKLAEVGVTPEKVEVLLIHEHKLVRRSFQPNERVRVIS